MWTISLVIQFFWLIQLLGGDIEVCVIVCPKLKLMTVVLDMQVLSKSGFLFLTGPNDYTELVQTLSFDSGNSERKVVFDISDDDVYEEVERFLARLNFRDPSDTNSVEIRPNVTTILIEDNDGNGK